MARKIKKIKIRSAELKRCGPGIRRLVLMKNKKILRAVKRDKKRIKDALARLKNIEEKEERVIPHPIFGPLIIVGKFWRRIIKIRAILDFAGNSYDLYTMGIKVNSHNHNFFTITATKRQLKKLIIQPATRQIRLPRLLVPYLEEVIPTAEINQIHVQGTKGNGVIVGVIDTVLHVEHHAFRFPTDPHNTRVLYMWVQEPDDPNAPGDTPETYNSIFTGYNYGRIYDQGTINAAIGSGAPYGSGETPPQISKEPSLPDPNGIVRAEHGTHVTGIAAGSGHLDDWTSPPANIGAAPLADIVYVCYPPLFSFETDVVDALNFIFLIKSLTGQAVVINNSYGTSLGPHNGTSIFDQVRNNMLDSYLGRSLVFAAGNDNDSKGFRKGTIATGQIESFRMTPNGDVDLRLDIWYKGLELDFRMDCETLVSGTISTGWILPPNELDETINGYITLMERDTEPISGMKAIKIFIQSASNAEPWIIMLRNTGIINLEYWAWVGPTGYYADLDGHSQGELTLGTTACARSILTVGACKKPEGANLEMITLYSGCGPTMDRRIKPEIVTVGGETPNKIESADSRTTGGYFGMKGTSMAAPIVSGSIALLFETNPNLNQDEIKALLTQTADKTNLNLDPEAAGFDQFERNAYGFGRLQMLAPYEHSRPLRSVDVWVRTADDDYGFEPYPGGCFCHAPEIKIIDSNGNETTTISWGQEHIVQIKIHNLGDNIADNTLIKLKYTRPWVAPNQWVQCQDSSNNPIEERADIPALSYIDFEFTQKWKPESSELPPDGTDWGDHYCLLIELDHPLDELLYHDIAGGGSDPWNKNIKGTNNVALRNLHIQ